MHTLSFCCSSCLPLLLLLLYGHKKLVRSVARRDGDNRTVSELIRFQDSLERLGLLWPPLDSLDKYQALELVRNLHVRHKAKLSLRHDE